jgi:hypothetical protein
MTTTALPTAISSQRIREELVEAVIKDLLGPANGREEEVDERHVSERYLVGMLAPRQQELLPEECDALEAGGAGTVEDGQTDYSAPQARTLFPASFGMSFCVDPKAEAIEVIARWGQYLREQSATLTTATGEPKLVWKRHPHEGGPKRIPLKAGRTETWRPVPDECPDVTIQGLIRKREDHWSVTLFLVNGQQEPKRGRDMSWLFQPELIAQGPENKAIFHRRRPERAFGKSDAAVYAEEQAMEMLYRHRVEFAVGHGVSVHAETGEGEPDRAIRISTRALPACEVTRATPPSDRDFPKLAGLALGMKELAETPSKDFAEKLEPLAAAYGTWIDGLEARLGEADLAQHQDAARAAITRCRGTLERVRSGIRLLGENEQAAEAFRFANRAMWMQRLHTIYAERKRRGEEAVLDAIDAAEKPGWYPFQLAFILLNLLGVTLLDHPDRTHETDATADLLWFATGGGKTEAYLGLAAYTMALRRLQGVVAGRAGESGVAVLMRYTLRLLTIQQFQRAATLLCCCEMIRREGAARGDGRWGAAPFRIGLWVGQRTTPNRTEDAAEIVKRDHGHYHPAGGVGASGSPHQLTHCPWCGTRIEPGRDIKVENYPGGTSRTLIYCGDALGQCPFTARQAPGEGLPVIVVDDEIYRRLPAMVIATVDKFAQMPWNGKVQMLFGQVEGYCGRHGFRSPEIEDADSHTARAPYPPAKTVPANPLRPPDLIIQDELHLISGPLGTLVGLYETAIDKLCSWQVNGKTVRPKVIASTATIRKAGDQVNAVFLRQVNIFPPHGLDARDNFFSLERPLDQEPGRLYLGVCAPGRRLKAALIRVYVAFLAAAQQLYERYGRAADPWMTLVGYFNSMRELGGMRRLVDDDVRSRLGKADQRGLARRVLSYDSLDELTSRKSSTDIPNVLDRLETPFDPAFRKGAGKAGEPHQHRRPLDVLLATNMVSVGVDVKRLGLMVVAGQPKATAEYIQATSRVGRQFPGVVCTVYNWARPRDLSHYETFEHYHATFYKHVEALSVTPFSPGAITRGLTALLVSCIRLPGTEFNENRRAGRIDRNHPYVKEAVETIARRAFLLGTGAEVERQVRGELNERIDQWLAEAQRMAGGRILGYKDQKDGVTVGLLRQPSLGGWDDFTCLNSLRDVEPTVGLLLDDRGLDDGPPAGTVGGGTAGSAPGSSPPGNAPEPQGGAT